MNTTRCLRSIPAILPVAWLVAMTGASAQGGRITIQLLPKPNQVVRYHSVQELQFKVPAPGAPADPSSESPASIAIVGTMDAVHTMAVGVPDDQGHAEARITYDQFTMQMSLNGQPMPLPSAADAILRQPFTTLIDRDGKIIDVKGTDENAALMASIKPILANTLSGPSSITLAPGETTTTPLASQLSLPLPGAGAGTMSLTGEMNYTLVAGGSAGRVAHLTTTLTGRLVTQEIQTAAGTMSLTMTMTGDGTLDVDVARGIVTLRKQRQMIDMQIRSGSTAGALLPPMKMTGQITSTVTAE